MNTDQIAGLKSKHEQVLDLINQLANVLRDLGVTHISAEDESLNGRTIYNNGRELLNFSSCSYLGLEHDPRLKKAVIDAVGKFGTQFSSSRAYVSAPMYDEAEHYLEKIFGKPVILTASVTLGHISNIPVLIGDNDVVILDSQVHDSVQTATQLLKSRNVAIEMIRHNRLDMLEERIKKLQAKHDKIWYLADGVYSMYGDFAPVKELKDLADKYGQLHLYIDDAHGMSWAGGNGCGYVLSQIPYHPKLFIATSTNKAFAAAGGVLVFPDEQSQRLVRNCGKTLIFSGPIQPPMLGAVVASAKIHLSREIYDLQDELQKKIAFFNHTAKLYNLPLINESKSPINFIGVGKPETGYNMVKRLMNLGFFVNLSVFPSVSYNNTGLRIPLTRHHSFEDIDNVLKAIAEQLPIALLETSSSMPEVLKAFKISLKVEK
jgi:7-keto-8-aminopelargonate synthetase-like enzyme